MIPLTSRITHQMTFFQGMLSHSASNRTVRLDFLDPIFLLKVHQPISQTTKRLGVALLPFIPQVLANQIEHGGEGAEAVVLLNMEL